MFFHNVDFLTCFSKAAITGFWERWCTEVGPLSDSVCYFLISKCSLKQSLQICFYGIDKMSSLSQGTVFRQTVSRGFLEMFLLCRSQLCCLSSWWFSPSPQSRDEGCFSISSWSARDGVVCCGILCLHSVLQDKAAFLCWECPGKD